MREGGQGTLCGWDRLVRARERADVCWEGREEEVVVVVEREEAGSSEEEDIVKDFEFSTDSEASD